MTYLNNEKAENATNEEYERHKLSMLGTQDDSKTALSQVEFNSIAKLFGRIKLQEETFEDVFVFYVTRRQLEIENGSETRIYNMRSTNLRHFQSVPKSDPVRTPGTSRNFYREKWRFSEGKVAFLSFFKS